VIVTPHPLYSPDIAPADFWLFGDLNKQMQNVEFESFTAVKEFIEEILRGIPADMYWRVFDHWIERLKRIIEHGGTYYEPAMHVSKLEDD
jgi:hypothetical protein